MKNARHDHTGRSTGRTRDRRAEKLDSASGPFFKITKQMVESPAWRVMSDRALKMLIRICIEHMNHGGRENGRLPVTFADFVQAGVRRQDIRKTEAELIALGFVERRYDGRKGWGVAKGEPAKFRLCHLAVCTDDNIEYATNAFLRHKSGDDARRAVSAALAADGKKRRPSGRYLDSSAETAPGNDPVSVPGTSQQSCRFGT